MHQLSPLPTWLKPGSVQIILVLALLWAFFYLTGDMIVEGLANASNKDAPKKLVVPQFLGSPTDGALTANTASQSSNSNSATAIENAKNDHYADEWPVSK
jgi:hypothetical protein